MNNPQNVEDMFALRGKHATRLLIFTLGLLPFSGCGAGMPWPTTQVVHPADVIGTWEYSYYDKIQRTDRVAYITFKADNQFVQHFPQPENQPVRTNRGTWKLSGSDVVLSDFLSIGWNDERLSMTWWVTHWFSTRLVLFGGDVPDPDHWSLLSRRDLVEHTIWQNQK